MSATGALPEFDAVILAGGRSARMAGVDKPGLSVGGVAMLVSVARAAADAGARKIVIVGPQRGGAVRTGLTTVGRGVRGGLTLVSEQPAGAGPVPALRRGLAEVTAPWLALLAADMPFLTGSDLTALMAAGAKARADGVVLADAGNRPQWLASGWQAGPLRTALRGFSGNSLHGLLSPLDFVPLRLAVAGNGPGPWLDCDTPDDLAAARRAIAKRIGNRSRD